MMRFAVVALAGVLAGCTPKDPTYSFKYAEQRARLANGVRLVVIPDKSSHLVEVHVRYEVGSNEDPPGKTGLAHLVEHMMFQHRMLGEDKPATFDLLPEIALGYNAYTIFDQTHYYLVADKEDVESLLKIEAYRMNARCQSIPPGQFDREREVVRNEIRGGKGTPEGLMYQLALQEVYPAGHPYSHDVGGDDRQLASITFDDVCAFLERYYTPDRATVIVTGNVDPAAVGRQFSYLFGGIPKREPAARAVVGPIELRYKRVEHELDIERPLVFVLWKLPAVNDPEFPKANALFLHLGKFARLLDEWEFASDFAVTFFGGSRAPAFGLILELFPDGDVDNALEYVWRAAGTAHWGVRHIDFDREAKNRVKMAFVEEIESLSLRAELVANAIQFPTGEVEFGATGQEYLINQFEKIDKLTSAGYRDFVKRTLAKERAVVVVFKPKKTGKTGDVRARLKYTAKTDQVQPEPLVEPAEALRPLPTPKSSSVLGTAERYALDNGMRVILLSYEGAVPIVHAELLFNAGGAFEPEASAGLAVAAAEFLRPPTNSNFTNWVSFAGEADDDHTTFVSRGLNIYTDVVIEALERTVKIGHYDQEALEAHQKRTVNLFKSATYRRSRDYQRIVSAALFGPDHPYTVKGHPTPDTVGRIGHDAASSFRRDHYSARNATLVVVGNFDKAAAKSKIAKTFGSWPSGRQDTTVPAVQLERSGPAHIGVVSKDRQQTGVTIGYPAPPGRDGQHAARLVLTEMLNEQMAGIRTQLGSTYGAFATRTDHIGPNAYLMGGMVDSERAGEALKVMRDKVDALRRGDDFERKFALARRRLLRQLLAESTETRFMAERLANIAVFGLGPDYYDTLVKYVAAASPAQVRALIDAELKPELEVVVCGADRPTLEKAFQEAGLAGVVYDEPKVTAADAR